MSIGEEDRIAFDYEYSKYLDEIQESESDEVLDYDDFLEKFQEPCEVDL